MFQHAGRTIGITPQRSGRMWTALVEIWLKGEPQTHGAHVMPFSAHLDSESAALDEAFETARRYIDMQARCRRVAT